MEPKPNFKNPILDIKVGNLDRAVDFYRDVLGFEFVKKDSNWAVFQVSGWEIHLYTEGGVRHGLEFKVEDIEKEVSFLKQKGIVFSLKPAWPEFIKALSDEVMIFPWGKMAVFSDSEGNELVLVEEKDE